MCSLYSSDYTNILNVGRAFLRKEETRGVEVSHGLRSHLFRALPLSLSPSLTLYTYHEDEQTRVSLPTLSDAFFTPLTLLLSLSLSLPCPISYLMRLESSLLCFVSEHVRVDVSRRSLSIHSTFTNTTLRVTLPRNTIAPSYDNPIAFTHFANA